LRRRGELGRRREPRESEAGRRGLGGLLLGGRSLSVVVFSVFVAGSMADCEGVVVTVSASFNILRHFLTFSEVIRHYPTFSDVIRHYLTSSEMH
jgi:hypothetical protein